ncbi:hypothetical protein G4B88_009080 [Cannabis sativa]|uniref:Uncharacterized protein n=1 Tax=Cannabis sativa TaxID=3483 RepID=A0A7J6HPM6_CANSA|nr:hypothetical protein G4B88_009080 [Cannabis sativa]
MVSPVNHDGPRKHRPVILPLPRAGGVRCSVKPASRITLHSRSPVGQSFVQTTRPNSQLGTGRPLLLTLFQSFAKVPSNRFTPFRKRHSTIL